MMKRRIALMLGTVLVVCSVLIGCAGAQDRVASQPESFDSGASASTGVDGEGSVSAEDEAAEGSLKTGLALSASVAGSTDAGEEDGFAQAELMAAAVTVDAEGKVVACTIDSVQTKVNFNAEGKITSDLASEFQTKNELGENYGMKAVSSVGKEWNEQAEAFAQYCVGKTAEEITGIAVNESGAAADADLAASCTVYIGGFQSIVVKAIENAK